MRALASYLSSARLRRGSAEVESECERKRATCPRRNFGAIAPKSSPSASVSECERKRATCPRRDFGAIAPKSSPSASVSERLVQPVNPNLSGGSAFMQMS